QLGDEAPRRAETRELGILVALLELAHVARREQHDPERLLDGDRVLAEAPGDVRSVLDLDVRLPAGLRHGKAIDAEDEAWPALGRALHPCELGGLGRSGLGNDRRRAVGAAARREEHDAERDQDGDGALHPAMLAHGGCPPGPHGDPWHGGSSIASRAAWISTNIRAKSSSGASGSRSPTGASRRPPV